MTRVLLVLALVGACAKKSEPPPPAPQGAVVPAMSAAEVQRSHDACAIYVTKVCACADKVPAVKHQCDLAKSLPEAVRLGLEVAASPDSKPADVTGAQGSVRKAVKECIEETAKLPTLGCE